MQLHDLPKAQEKSKKRVGRGGKRGFTCGRGTKGQKARAGRKLRPAERDLINQLPKLRGFANNPKSSAPQVVNVLDLERAFKDEDKGVIEVTEEVLKQKGLIPSRFSGAIKILGKGKISVSLNVKGIPMSASAREKIEKAGGTVDK